MVWNIRTKFIALTMAAVIACAALGVIATVMFSQVERAVAHTASLSAAIRLQGDADMMHDAIHGNVLAGMLAVFERDPGALTDAAAALAENGPRFRRDLAELAKAELTPATQEKLRSVRPVLDAYLDNAEGFFRSTQAGAPTLRASLETHTRTYEQLAGPMEKLSDAIEADIASASADLAERQRFAQIAIGVAIAVSLLLIAGVAWSIYHAIQTRLSVAVRAVQTVAGGDLSQEVPEGRADEIGELLRALNGMREGLSTMFVMFQAKAVELDEASHTLVNAAARVSHGSAEQRDASESIAATLEQMNSSIEAVAEGMKSSHELAQRAGDASASGARAIDQLIEDMSRIETAVKLSAGDIAKLGEESKSIGAVVNVIKEIADQTNLLALNAAIEAARAGEQGRGFAVVADEVRKLAERTASSTEQIGGMIAKILAQVDTSVSGVQTGVAMVETGVSSAQDANAVLAEIAAGVRDLVANVAQAADSMREQATAVQHVTGRAERITGMAEQNAVVSTEAEQSARALSTVSETLRVAANTFKVKDVLPARSMQQLKAAAQAPRPGEDKVALF